MSENSSKPRRNSAVDSNSYLSQLRRLKIQEEILSGNVNKSYNTYMEKCDDINKLNTNNYINKYILKLRNSYMELKNLYEDIKMKSNNHEALDVNDINDLKRDVFKLEESIKSMKQFLRNELDVMQSEEITLLEKSNENNIEERKLNVFPKRKSRHFKEIVPSPVRVMINAPLKYNEIHEFHNFMKNSPNRYGGWNEYNHNLFVKIWNKYNGIEEFTSKSLENNRVFQDFKDEAMQKISGINLDDLNSHFDWYSRYIYLKMCQQKALEKWKENRRKIKKPLRDTKLFQNSSKCTTNIIDSEKNVKNGEIKKENENHSKIIKKLHCVSTLMKPTKQWLNRQEINKEITVFQYNVANISKLSVPQWRKNLNDGE